MQFLFEVEQFLFLALHHFGYGYAGPARNYVGYVVCVDLLFNERFVALHLFQLFLNIDIFFLLFLDFGIADFGHFGIVAFAFGPFGFEFQLLDVYLVLLNAVYQLFLRFPFCLEVFFKVTQVGEFFFYVLDFYFIAFTLNCLALDFELSYLACDFVKSLWYAVALDS